MPSTLNPRKRATLLSFKPVPSRHQKGSPLHREDPSFTDMSNNLIFINTSTQTSPRDRELARSQANSHVARLGHRRRPPNHSSRIFHERPVKHVSADLHSPLEDLPTSSRSSSILTDTPRLEQAAAFSPSESLFSSGSDPPASQRAASYYTDPSPWHLIAQGNSDPFACMPIPVTPAVKALIVFFRSHLLDIFTEGTPPLNSPRVVFRMASQGLFYDTNVDSLQDECSFRSFLVFVSALRAKHTQSEDAYRELRVLQMRSQRVLRWKIQNTMGADDAILYSVLAHFTASVTLQEYQQAVYHGKYLRDLLLTRVNNNISIPLGLLKQAIWVDTQLAIARFQPSILDGESWIPLLLRPIEQSIADCLSELPAELITSVDPIISSEPLRSAIVRLRQSFALTLNPPQQLLDQVVSGVLFAALNISISRLQILSYCIDAQIRPRESVFPIYSIERLHYCLEVMVSAALIYLLDRSSMYTCRVIRYMPKSDMLMSFLQLRISDALECVSELGGDVKSHQNACLFALFVELQGRRWMSTRDGTVLSDRSDLEFTTLARSMDLRKWNDVKGICSGFFLSPVVEPKGEDWVDELLSRDLEGSEVL